MIFCACGELFPLKVELFATSTKSYFVLIDKPPHESKIRRPLKGKLVYRVWKIIITIMFCLNSY